MTQSTRATRAQLEELHGILADILLDYLKGDEHTAAMLNVCRAFLVNNGVMKNLSQVQSMKASLDDLRDINVPFLPEYLVQ